MRIVQLGVIQVSLVKLQSKHKALHPKNLKIEYKKSSIIS